MARVRLLIVTLLLSPATVLAQPAGAISLRDEGIADIRANRVADGCKKVYASLDMWREPSTLSWAAACKAIEHKYATAADNYREVVATANDANTRKAAQTALSKIASKISYLVIHVPASGPAGVTVTRDGVSVPTAALGVTIPVDDGEVVIASSAPGFETTSQTITVSDARTVHITLPDLKPVPVVPIEAPVEPPPKDPPVKVETSGANPPVETRSPVPPPVASAPVAEAHDIAAPAAPDAAPQSPFSLEVGGLVGVYNAPADFSTGSELSAGLEAAFGYRFAGSLLAVAVTNADVVANRGNFERMFFGAGVAVTRNAGTIRLTPGVAVLTGLDRTLIGPGVDVAAAIGVSNSISIVLDGGYAFFTESSDVMAFGVVRLGAGVSYRWSPQ